MLFNSGKSMKLNNSCCLKFVKWRESKRDLLSTIIWGDLWNISSDCVVKLNVEQTEQTIRLTNLWSVALWKSLKFSSCSLKFKTGGQDSFKILQLK